ncbi:MAG TPA: aldo/keto reductase [Actinomycetota bacterium]|nr:aldo/keto reductase [Actinomycetota bacterium]
MERRRLGASGPEISVIGYGAWEAGGTSWGPNESDEAVVDAIRSALDAGIDWIDTAEVYGVGASERLVGRAIAGRRDDVVIATKVGDRPDGTGFRPDEVARACDGSLERLGVDHIDLYQVHWKGDVPVEETWGAMAALQDAGKARWIGVSNYEREDIERCLAERHVDSLQPEFSMLDRTNAELIRWCGERGIGVVSYGPLAYGMLTGRFTRDDIGRFGDWRDEQTEGVFAPDAVERNLAAVERLRGIAERLGATTGQVALAWNVRQPGVTSAIAGSRSRGHIRENAEAGSLQLDDATVAEIDALLD